ncbi:MAG: hypothetical protein P8013_10305 [Candidatus Sulfobium sp.]
MELDFRLRKYKRFFSVSVAAICIGFFGLIISSGCATKGAVKKVSDEEALRERVVAYWGFRSRGEYDRSYIFESPLYREKISLVNYIKRSGNPMVKYRDFEVVKIDKEDEDHAEVRVKVNGEYKIPGAKPFVHDMFVNEQWVRLEGQWYHVFEQFIPHPGN